MTNTVAEAYTKYMTDLKMDTCWNKAHFFAQVVVESGRSLKFNNENFNYSSLKLRTGFEYLRGQKWIKGNLAENKGGYFEDGEVHELVYSYFIENPEDAEKYGRKDLDVRLDNGVQKANQEQIANLAYGPNTATGRELSNTKTEDGWRFKGRGLIQLTGRYNYENADKIIKKYFPEMNILTDENDRNKVGSDTEIAVLSSMTYWVDSRRNIQMLANGQDNTDKVSKLVGSNVAWINKRRVFDLESSIFFMTEDCQWGILPLDTINIITYHIYHSGEIKKEIPETNEYPEHRKYIYHDANNKEHPISVNSMIVIPEVSTNRDNDRLRVVEEGFEKKDTWTHTLHENVNAGKSYYYYDQNGDLSYIIVEAKEDLGGGIRKYHVNQAEQKEMIRMHTIKSEFANCTFKDTDRFYCGADQYAVFIGALAYSKITCESTGCTHKDGTGFPSLTHVNGYGFDLVNNGNDLDLRLMKAFLRFNCKNFRVGSKDHFTPISQLDGAIIGRDAGHNHHLHCGPINNVKIEVF